MFLELITSFILLVTQYQKLLLVADGYKSAFHLIFCALYLAKNTNSAYNFICNINILK
jgi:hypothetical protein